MLHGRIEVQSYTLTDKNPATNLYEALKYPSVETTAEDPPLTLSPDEGNLHEIFAINGSAAFLDILSPPYGDDPRTGFERDCHYYRELAPSGVGYIDATKQYKTLLVQVNSPSYFWCDQAEYCGPPLKGVIERGKIVSAATPDH